MIDRIIEVRVKFSNEQKTKILERVYEVDPINTSIKEYKPQGKNPGGLQLDASVLRQLDRIRKK